jgi:hypothetical protein
VSRRFIDTEIWEKDWYIDLPPAEKCAFNFITQRCDYVGVWTPNKRFAEMLIGSKIEWDHLLENCNDNIRVLDCGKWWLKDFCFFQYTVLDENSKAPPIKSYIKRLQDHGLWNDYQTLLEEYVKTNRIVFTPKPKGTDRVSVGKAKGKPTLSKGNKKGTPSHKEKEKEKDKEKEEEKDQTEKSPSVPDTLNGRIKAAFLSKNDGGFSNYAKEAMGVKGIIKKAEAKAGDDAEVFIQQMMEQFWKMKSSGEKWWKDRPFLPSTLNSSGVWDQVLERIKDNKPSSDSMDVVNEIFGK